MKKIYIDFEMNMPNNKGKRDTLNADIIAIGAVKYDEHTGKIEKFKSLIKPMITKEVYPHIEELTKITSEDLYKAPTYENVMRDFKSWLGTFSDIKGIYTFGNLDLVCFNNIDKISSQKNKHPRFLNNIRSLFVDIKDKYLDCGIRCVNYISLKNLLSIANVEFSGEVHDPLDDAYNLFLLDSVLDDNESIRELLIIKDMIKPPFNIIDEELDEKFEKYKNYFYKNDRNYDINSISIEIINVIRKYILSLSNIDIYNIDIIKDISKKIITIEKLYNIKDGYFYVLENLCLDIKDLIDDLMLYKLSISEYKYEIMTIIELFDEDLKEENIDIYIK
ncbi:MULTISPECIES: 3'-5' exonuclease [unclassified Romboutsia]|uniref:3'-5' exonuclease n=1 Tax=unclassified Romboutsia TaxID=2626894 RepID=UPI000821EF8C|nr:MULTISPECIES: 3'-5' exonuclease [unclassified Romboutsia]SCH38620.1 DNA polymerase III subunit epsilon [uncultured Clostridium sp.]